MPGDTQASVETQSTLVQPTYRAIHKDSELFASDGLQYLPVVEIAKANFYFQYVILQN